MSHPLTNLSDRALKVLVILLLAGQPLGLKAIRAEYKKPLGENSLKDALYELEHEQFIARVAFRGEAYVALSHARQMILGETASLPNGETSPAEVSNLSRRGFGAPLEVVVGTDLPESAEPPLPPGPDETSPAEVSFPQKSPTFPQAALATLDDAGIAEPARSQIAALSWATPGYIAAHVESAESLGLAIYRIKHHFRAPKTKGQLDDEARRKKYLSWLE